MTVQTRLFTFSIWHVCVHVEALLLFFFTTSCYGNIEIPNQLEN